MILRKYKSEMLVIILLGLVSLSAFYFEQSQIPLEFDEIGTSIDQSKPDDHPLISDILLSEPYFPIIDNQSFDFSSQESVTRTFSQQSRIEGNSTFNVTAPSNYTLANISVSLDVIGDGFEQLIIENQSSKTINYIEMHAQSFSITKKVWIEAVYLHFSVKTKIPANITIRKENHTGDILYLNNTEITVGGWKNIVDGPLILEPGQYFVRMDVLVAYTDPQYIQWLKSEDNSTLTLYQDTAIGFWQIANFDLGLIIDTLGFIENISAVDVFVNDQICLKEDALRYLDLTLPIVNYTIELIFTSNISLVYTYDIFCTYFRFTPQIPTIEVDKSQNELYFNFSLDLIEPSLEYLEYRVIIDQIYADYININVFNATVSVESVTRISPLKIEFYDWADRLEFVSSNAIEQISVIRTNHVGDTTNINVSTEYPGNITLFIYKDDLLIHSQTNETDGFLSLDWELTPPLDVQNLDFQILFFGQNHAGWGEEEIDLIQRTNMIASPIVAYAFDEIVLECNYQEWFSNQTVDDATIVYGLEELSKQLNQTEFNNYQSTLDLDRYNFLPGLYEITYIATREGYDPQSYETELQILSRTINLDVIQNKKSLKPLDELRFTVQLEDNLGGGILLRPVDVKISVFAEAPLSAHSAQDQNASFFIYSNTAENVENNCTISIPIEKDFELGNYSLSMEILSDFYQGSYLQNKFIEISKPGPTTYYYYFSAIALLGISIVVFVVATKRQVKKSIAGIMIMHEDGILIGNKIESNFTAKDPLLISGAMAGMIMLIKEITGGGIKTIAIDEGYVSMIRGEKYWLILFLRRNPVWIQGDIRKCVKQITNQIGKDIMSYSGLPIPISLDGLTSKHFNKIIEDESLDGRPVSDKISERMAKEAQTIADSPYTPSNDQNISENDAKDINEQI